VLLTLVLLKIIAKIYIINKEEEQDGACVYIFSLPSLFSSCWDGFIRTWRCNFSNLAVQF
jgi:hypothetical protein